MTRFRRHTRALAALLPAAAIGGCVAPPSAPDSSAPRAMVEDRAVRSVFYPEPMRTCRAAPCPGVVPPEYVAAFRRALEAAGFEIVHARGYAAPVARIRVDHVATTPTECDMRGVVYVADNAIDIKRSYLWQRAAGAPTFTPAKDRVFSPDVKRHVLLACLAGFAQTARAALSTGAAPDRAAAAP